LLLLPIGHDATIRRFPALTVGVMAVCVLLQIHRTVYSPSESEYLDLATERERIEVTTAVAQACDVSEGRPEDMEACLRALRGEQGEASEETRRALAALEARERALKSHDLVFRLGFVPAGGFSVTTLTSTFVHGGWLHLLGNLLFLWLVGCNLEDRWGRAVFLSIYLAGGMAASLAFWLWHPGGRSPLVGASGAISAAMGAFLVCFARTQIRIWYLYFIGLIRTGTFRISAYWAFPLWFAEQAFYAWFESYGHSDVAYSSHVGGFVFGFAAALGLRLSGAERKWLLPRTAQGTEWQEDPTLVAALDAAARGSKAEALEGLRSFLSRRPDHADAQREACRLGMELGDGEVVRSTAAAVIARLAHRREAADVVEVFRGAERLGVPLPGRAVAEATHCAMLMGDAEAAVSATRRMMREHPGSPLLPRVLWDAALAQEKSGRADLAKKTLSHLAERFAHDPFGEQARRKLGTP
jgi:membrane associated rhomboid family serine protease